MSTNVLYYIFLVLLILVFFNTIFLPLLIRYVRHRNFKRFLRQEAEDKNAWQSVRDTLIRTRTYMFYADDKGRVLVDKRFFESIGQEYNDVSVESFANSFTPEDKERVLELFHKSYDQPVELQLQTRQSESTDVHHFVLWFGRSTYEDRPLFLGFLYDVDALYQQQQEEREACRREDETNLKTSFLASMGHEIRTPLNAIIGFSRMLVDNYKDLSQDELNMIRETLHHSKNQLLELLDNVMKYAGNTDGKLDLPLAEKQVCTLMDELHHMHTVLVPKHLEFIYLPGSAEDRVMTNRSSLLQIISNLMNNAVKFTESGSITMGWERIDNEVVIFVQDTGIGISPENQNKVFDKYFKKSSMMAGAGIGLHLCKRLTEAMNGRIQVKSELGKGSRFEVVLPAQ